jgi:hypothetical protein
MPLIPAFLLMAQGTQAAPAEITLHHRRPSAVLAGVPGLRATLVPNDDRGTVSISGAPKDVATAREALRLADVPRRTVHLRVTVESPVDHLTWEVDARLVSGQKWTTADDETGAEVVLKPRIDADGTLFVQLLARRGKVELASAMRLNRGQADTLTLGTQIRQKIEVGEKQVKETQSGVALPKITVRYLGG